ncbi:MAG TPA: hypothetical protein VGC02_03470 [Methanobacterium sp.]
METYELFNRIKLVVIIALIVGFLGVVTYLIYGFTFMWQVIVTTLINIFLGVVAILFLFASIYLGIKILMLNRELDKQQKEIERISHNLKNCNRRLRKKKSGDEG